MRVAEANASNAFLNHDVEVLYLPPAELPTESFSVASAVRFFQMQFPRLPYWRLTCQSFHSEQGWAWICGQAGYRGGHGFIFFE